MKVKLIFVFVYKKGWGERNNYKKIYGILYKYILENNFWRGSFSIVKLYIYFI